MKFICTISLILMAIAACAEDSFATYRSILTSALDDGWLCADIKDATDQKADRYFEVTHHQFKGYRIIVYQYKKMTPSERLQVIQKADQAMERLVAGEFRLEDVEAVGDKLRLPAGYFKDISIEISVQEPEIAGVTEEGEDASVAKVIRNAKSILELY